MEQLDRNKIMRNIKHLSQLENFRQLVTELIDRGVIDRAFFDRIQNSPQYILPQDKMQEFFLRYTKRGPDAFRILVESLKKTGHVTEAQGLETIERNRSVSSMESPSESETTNSSSSNTSGGGNHLFPFESPGSSNSSSSTNGVSGRGAEGFDPTAVHWANRITPISPDSSPQARRLSDLTMGELPALQIVVKKATMYNQGILNPEEAYCMMSRPRGFALIVNNIEFLGDTGAKRAGAEVDTKNLDELLQGLGFQTMIRQNVLRDDLLNPNTGILKTFIDQFGQTTVDACVVAFMSHGGAEDSIRTSDPDNGNSRKNHWHLYDDIIPRFNNRNCDVLVDKPKVFIIQACRGDFVDRGVRRTETDGKNLNQYEINNANIPQAKMMAVGALSSRPTHEDILICYSTVPGFVSNRDTLRGTWYIQCLCEIFMDFAHETEIHKLLQKVSRRMREISSEYGDKQMCSFKNIGFSRDLYFNPGLFAEESRNGLHPQY